MIGRLRALRKRRRVTRRDVVLTRPSYADRHPGATMLVLGNGPSLANHRDALLRLMERERPVVLGGNHITPFTVPDYHAFTNRKRAARYAETVRWDRSRVLVSPYFTDELLDIYFSGGPVEKIAYVSDDDATFKVSDGVIAASGRTVSVLLIGVAAVMGAQRILVAGLDGFPKQVDGAAAQGVYHAATDVLKEEQQQYEEIDRYTRRFLDEIQAWLAREGREPFAIVTPTAYAEHHRPELLS